MGSFVFLAQRAPQLAGQCAPRPPPAESAERPGRLRSRGPPAQAGTAASGAPGRHRGGLEGGDDRGLACAGPAPEERLRGPSFC